MFHRYGKKTKHYKGKALKDLIGVETPEALLADDKRQALLSKIEDSSALSANRFNPFCGALIHNLINHCQSLPETMNSYYALPGGILDYALNRTEAALHLFRQYIIVEGDVSEEQKLWLYALFSASILKGIGKLQTEYQVKIFDINGQKLKSWNALLESISAVGSYYHYEIQGDNDEALRRRLNILLAKMLIPSKGFSWIASNPEVLKTWLALLNEDWESAGTLGAILIRADAIAIQRYISEYMMLGQSGKGARSGRIGTFVDTSHESNLDRETAAGFEFIQWLMQALEKGELMINKAPLFMVPGGMLMSADIFKLFVTEHPAFKNWQAVQHGVLSLGLHSQSADGGLESRFEQANTQKMVSGIVLENYAVALPEQVKVNHLNTGKVAQTSATELINKAQTSNDFTQKVIGASPEALRHLDARGQWQVVKETNNTLQPGSKFSG